MKMMSWGRRFAIVIFFLVMAALSLPVTAQTYPSKPIKLLIGFAPGGNADILARIVTPRLSTALGQRIIIENRPGASSNIALEFVAKSPPDGYTLILSTPDLVINGSLYTSVRFDPVKDFSPISMLADAPNFVVVLSSFPANDLKEFIEVAKSKQPELFFAQVASGNYLATLMLNMVTGIKTSPVPYKGAGVAIPALLAGEVQFMVTSIGAVLPLVRGGKLRALAVTSATRSELAPDIPTVAELGFSGYLATNWYGFLAPAGTPRPIIDRLNTAIRETMTDPEIKSRFATLATSIIVSSPEEFSSFIRSEMTKWYKVVKDSGAKIE